MQLELTNNLVIQCDKCGTVHIICKYSLEVNVSCYESSMGDEVEYIFDGECECNDCGNCIRYSVRGFEYPVGALNYDDSECYGGHFVQQLEVAVNYYEFGYDFYEEENIYSAVNQACINIDRVLSNNEDIYMLSSRQFEELVAEVFIRQGYSIEVTPATRDGGCDIIATRNIGGLPFMLLIECKCYVRNSHVGVQLVRSLLGVQTDRKANKAVLVTTSSFSKDAKKLAERQQYLISLVDYENLLQMMHQ